jgi:Tol biopolymer transport system component
MAASASGKVPVDGPRLSPRLCRVLVPVACVLVASGCAYVTRASVDSAGGDPNGPSADVSISDDGRYVAFVSAASDLVPGDTNGVQDVFVRDLVSGTTTLVSADATGGPANGSSLSPRISGDGRFVAFESFARDLGGGEDGVFADVFVRDLDTATTTLVSAAADGGPTDSGSNEPAISDGGRFVAFHSGATNLLAGGNASGNVFLRDRETGATTQVSVDVGGGAPNGWSGAPDLSDDGRFVAFASEASDLVPGDTNGLHDVFVRDLATHTTTLASLDHAIGGDPFVSSTSPSLSADGRAVAFAADWTDPTGEHAVSHVFVRDLQAGVTTLVSASRDGSQGTGASGHPSISDGGRTVAFASSSAVLVAGDTNDATDVFVRDLTTSTTRRASLDAVHREAQGASGGPALSGDGRSVAFTSTATNLVAGDGTSGGGGTDVFVRAPSAPGA